MLDRVMSPFVASFVVMGMIVFSFDMVKGMRRPGKLNLEHVQSKSIEETLKEWDQTAPGIIENIQSHTLYDAINGFYNHGNREKWHKLGNGGNSKQPYIYKNSGEESGKFVLFTYRNDQPDVSEVEKHLKLLKALQETGMNSFYIPKVYGYHENNGKKLFINHYVEERIEFEKGRITKFPMKGEKNIKGEKIFEVD